jgi:hypothetical protein
MDIGRPSATRLANWRETMGNPAGVKKKKREKRRKRFEARVGPGAYLPKEVREQARKESESTTKK